MTSPEPEEEPKQRDPELARLAWPIAVAMTSSGLSTMADTLYASRLGASAVGAVGLGGVLAITTLCFSFGVVRAGKVLASQAIGRSGAETDEVRGVAATMLVTAASLGVLVALIAVPLGFAVPWLAGGGEAADLAQRYLTVRLLGAPLTLLAFALRELRAAHGDGMSPMRAALAATALHIVASGGLILGAGYGIEASAASLVCSHGVEAALLAFAQRSSGFGRHAFMRSRLFELWRLGWPLGTERLLNLGSFSTMVTLIARTGDAQLAAHQMVLQIAVLALLPEMAFGEAACVLSGRAVGAGRASSVRDVARRALMAAGAYGASCALVTLVFGTAILGHMTHDPTVLDAARRLIPLAAAWQLLEAAYSVGAGVLRGIGDVRFAGATMAGGAWLFAPACAAWLGVTLGWGAAGAWTGIVLELVAVSSVLWWRIETSRRRSPAPAAS